MKNVEKITFEELIKKSVKENISIVADPFKKATVVKEVFDVDSFEVGMAMKVSNHLGEEYYALVVDCGLDYIQCYRVSKDLLATLVEIPLEEYLSGNWIITKIK